MKKIVSLLLLAVLALGVFAGCGSKEDGSITIAVPNDTTNEARALLLLEEKGYIKLKDGADIKATVKDIAENPYNIKFKEVEAAQLPNTLKDVDYAVINSNYAISAKLNPVEDSLAIEDSASAYSNILAVKEGNENTDTVKALKAALESKKVADFIADKYSGAVVIVVAKNVTLDIKEFTDYVQPNKVVDSGEIDANYFQHTPYLDDFNAENGTHVVKVSAIHVEPMGLYGGKQTSLDAIKK